MEDTQSSKPATQADAKSGLLCKVKQAFTEHPQLANETYLQHLVFTLGMASRLFVSSVALLVHGIFPFLCTHKASKTIRTCHSILDDRAIKTGGLNCDNKKD